MNTLSHSLFISFLSLFLISSCSSSSPKKSSNTVDLAENSLSEQQRPRNKTSSTYGPGVDSPASENRGRIREPIISLFFTGDHIGYPAFIGFMDRWESRDLPLAFISGFGTGAVFAAQYAKWKKAALVEWQNFKFFKNLEFKAPKKRWAYLRTNLKESVGDKPIQQVGLSLGMPVYVPRTNRFDLVFKKKTLLELLDQQFNMVEQVRWGQVPPLRPKQWDRVGVDLVFWIELGSAEQKERFAVHPLQGYADFMVDSYEYFEGFNLNISPGADEIGTLASFIIAGKKNASAILDQIEQSIQAWKQEQHTGN